MTSVNIITKHSSYNYGAMLQAYALQNTLNKMGAQAKIIDLRPPRPKTSWNYRNPKDVVRKLFYSLHERELLEGYKKFEEFIDFFDKTEWKREKESKERWRFET